MCGFYFRTCPDSLVEYVTLMVLDAMRLCRNVLFSDACASHLQLPVVLRSAYRFDAVNCRKHMSHNCGTITNHHLSLSFLLDEWRIVRRY
jgi:hypothetical protein